MKKSQLKIILILAIILSSLMVTKSFAIEETKIDVKYEYKKDTNTVVVTMTSNNELKNNKTTWKLSEDKKTFTYEFDKNTTYTSSVTDVYERKVYIPLQVTQIDESPANVVPTYQYNSDRNTVTVTLTSDKRLLNNKTTWKLSEDGKVFTYEFNKNTTYKSSVTDIYGNKIYIPLKVTQIDESPAKVVPTYEYNKERNTVTVTLTSDKRLLNNKTTWKLSEDEKIFIYEFDKNTTYTSSVTDIYGNKVYIPLEVTQIDESPAKVVPTYQYNSDKNTVTVTLTSDKRLLNNKTTWKLSEDEKVFKYEFDENTIYTSSVTDIYGNKIYIPLQVTQIKETKIDVKYQYNEETNTVTVTMTSNNELKNNKTTWKLSEDKKTYTYEFESNTIYTSSVTDIYGKKVSIPLKVDQIKLGIDKGIYGSSGAKIKGVSGGSNLEYFKFGYGENVLFATFCVHGYEDAWDRDGEALVNIANDFFNRLVSDGNGPLAKKWTIYVFPEVNPDGRRLGTTNNGPGRTTIYSKAGKGIDMNRCWQTGSDYQRYTSKRNYNGTTGFQAYEAASLRDFLLSHKSKNGETILVDLHGWLDQLIGDEEICQYYEKQYSSNTLSYGRYGTQYLIAWGRENLGAKVALVELPEVENIQQVKSMKLSEKYINATMEMLENEAEEIK